MMLHLPNVDKDSRGLVKGVIIGDVVGFQFEMNNHKSTDFTLFTPANRFTDDSVMTIAVADWLLSGAPLQTTMSDFFFGGGILRQAMVVNFIIGFL